MILWCDGAHDPAENMRRDAALLAAAESGVEPVLRLFGFAPPGITLGMNQDPAGELDLARCAAEGVPWAIRPTGGRAIFHAEEWTYALATPRDDPTWGGSPAGAYDRASLLLVRSLRRLGVPADLAARSGAQAVPSRRGDGQRVRGGAALPAGPCFASTARHEVVLDGRKLVGSAQRRTARALLQQGSVLLGTGHLRLADYLPLAASERDRVRDALRRSSGPAGGLLGSAAPLERWADALTGVLGAGASRIDGAEGAFLLTRSESGSYTAPTV